MSAEREEYLRLKAAAGVREMSPERREYLRLKADSSDLASMRFEPEAAPAVSTMVSPEFAQVPAPEEAPSFGILPKGTGEKFERALPQWPITEDMSAGQKIRRTLGNLLLGAVKFPVRMGTAILEEPYKVPQAVAEFIPSVAERISKATGGLGLTGKYGLLRPEKEEITQARRELMEEPFDVALLGLPVLKGLKAPRIKAPKPKPVVKSVIEAARAELLGQLEKTKELGVKFFTETEIKGMTEAELLRHTGRKIPKAAKPAKTPEAIAKELEVEYGGLSERPQRGADGKILKDAEGKAVTKPEYVFTDPKTKSSFSVTDLSEVAPELKSVRKDFAAVKKPPVVEPVVKEPPKIIGLNKAEIDRIRRNTELDKLPDVEKRKAVDVLERAKADRLDESALETADHVLKSHRPITDAEHAGMVIKGAKLADEYDGLVRNASNYIEKGDVVAAQMERSRAEAVIDQLDKLTQATKSGRREVARALSIGRMMITRETYDLAHVIQRARAAKGGKLTPKETARIEGLVAEVTKLEKRIAGLEVKGATASQLERVQVLLETQKKKIRGGIENLTPWTPRRVFGETVNTLRTLKATADMSGILRQGLVLSITRPKLAAKSFGKAFLATFSKHKAEQIDFAIRRMDQHYLRERAGLHLSEFGEGARLAKREEYFMAQLIERVPVVGDVVKASNRNMATFLNLMRVGAFDQFLLKYPNASRAELKAWANWVNVASGRGNLGHARGMANELSLAIFAPRFAVSRVQTPFMMLKYFKHPNVRKQIARDYAGLVGLGTTALSLAALSGLDVGLNPREADFGKIRVGDTRIDMWAGLQQPARLIARIGVATTDRTGVTGKELAKSEKDFDPVSAIGRFAGFKLAPSVTIPRELLTEETVVGEPRTPSKTALRALIPLVYDDIADAYRAGGVPRAGLGAGLSFFGVSVNTYGDSEWRVRRDIKNDMRKGDFTNARTRAYQWNMEHPDRKIHSVRTASDTLNIVTGRSIRSRQRPAARR